MTVMIDELFGIIEREFYSFDVPQLVAVIEELLGDGGDDVKNRPPRRLAAPLRGGELKPTNNGGGGRIFFEVDADLSFPPADVGYVGIDAGHTNNIDTDKVNNNDRIDDDGPAATVRLPVMNLLGASSPLPITFSDHITRGRRDADMYADFLSILQNRLHALWLDAQRKHSLWGASTPLNDRPSAAEKIFASMTGLPVNRVASIQTSPHPRQASEMSESRPQRGKDLPLGVLIFPKDFKDFDFIEPTPEPTPTPTPAPPPRRPPRFPDFALAGLWQLSNRTRSAQGLKELLYAAFGDIPIYIEENAGRWAAVSNARPLGGAARLGRNATVGTRVYDRTSTFRITLGPLDFKTYRAFMPGENNYLLINEIVSVYLNEPVICEITVTCKLSDLPRARLGGDGSDGGNVLGRTAALGLGGGGVLAAYSKPPTVYVG